MTYEEALQCEEHAKESLKEFPMEVCNSLVFFFLISNFALRWHTYLSWFFFFVFLQLRIPILYLANKTSRTSFSDMLEDVFQFARERYFIGEMAEASFTEDSWCECHVLTVIEPTQKQIDEYLQENS